MSLYAFLNFLMVIAVGGAIGVLCWWFKSRDFTKRITAGARGLYAIVLFRLFRCVIVGMALGLLVATFISW
ncbi:hypothetical protein CH29_gp09 [Achromobacter phage JWAlpha]|uniref:Uncharacterized protein n=1 Tax=Achromobacter phage JWAlpha TaxID=1416009 RepID=V9VCT3_9CAUD|nr:hypothetical protein CH29_gp09 [Achromobacter phage JWAlpha]AHC93962.1 hypothetical protein JJJB_0009 [Achromobacter phage JWAlpha]